MTLKPLRQGDPACGRGDKAHRPSCQELILSHLPSQPTIDRGGQAHAQRVGRAAVLLHLASQLRGEIGHHPDRLEVLDLCPPASEARFLLGRPSPDSRDGDAPLGIACLALSKAPLSRSRIPRRPGHVVQRCLRCDCATLRVVCSTTAVVPLVGTASDEGSPSCMPVGPSPFLWVVRRPDVEQRVAVRSKAVNGCRPTRLLHLRHLSPSSATWAGGCPIPCTRGTRPAPCSA